MSSPVTYLDKNVLEAAKDRIRKLFDDYDYDFVNVSFSGGKDSLVCLHLLREVQLELGIPGPTNCFFYDEELIPDPVIDFVLKYANDKENWNMKYYAVAMKSTKFILGETHPYVQWDPSRPWVRPKPAIAITAIKGHENEIPEQRSMNGLCVEDVPGRIATITGIRCDESLIRRVSVLGIRGDTCHIAKSDFPNVAIIRPIYDWSQSDVFRYFYDRGIQYCPIYDEQTWNGHLLRVGTPFLAESAKRLHKQRSLYPVFYQQLVQVFPEMLIQAEYWRQFGRDTTKVTDAYEPSFRGILKYIDENIQDPKQANLARDRVAACFKRRKNKQNAKDPTGGYPLLYVFRALISGHYKRRIQMLIKATPEMLEYEERYKAVMKNNPKVVDIVESSTGTQTV